jgi:ABC-type microcin C transport system duplicated ATPase subunit YejF
LWQDNRESFQALKRAIFVASAPLAKPLLTLVDMCPGPVLEKTLQHLVLCKPVTKKVKLAYLFIEAD